MNICIIGKIPPIQGGVSNHVLWIAYYLAEKGHEVHIVTNAEEVEEDYRFVTLDFEIENSTLQSPLKHPRIHVHSSQTDRHQLYIPQANPYVSKLASIATDVIEKYDCSIIFAYYFEPYCVAAYLASTWTDTPFFITHAGSDVARLMNSPYLKTAYQRILRSAHGILSTEKLLPLFLQNGVDLSKIEISRKHIELVHFNKDKYHELDLNKYIDYVKNHPSSYVQEHYSHFLKGKINTEIPIIGIYGKLGPYKGQLELIRTLGKLKEKGIPFQLVLLGQGKDMSFNTIRQEIEKAKIEDQCWLLPFISPWLVPSFIRTCDLVCFLEHNFPIKIHMPGVPQQVLACRKPLLVSREIAEKQPFFSQMIHMENCVIVQPDLIESFSETFKALFSDRNKLAEMGQKGFEIIKDKILSKEDAMEHVDTLFKTMSQKAEAKFTQSKENFEWYVNNYGEMLKHYFTVTTNLFNKEIDLFLREFLKQSYGQEASSLDQIRGFCQYMKANVIPTRNHDRELMEEAVRFDAQNFEYVQSQPPLVNLEDSISVSEEVNYELNSSIKIDHFNFNLIENLKPSNQTVEKRKIYVIFKPRAFFFDIGIRELSPAAYQLLTEFNEGKTLSQLLRENPTYQDHKEKIEHFIVDLSKQNILTPSEELGRV